MTHGTSGAFVPAPASLLESKERDYYAESSGPPHLNQRVEAKKSSGTPYLNQRVRPKIMVQTGSCESNPMVKVNAGSLYETSVSGNKGVGKNFVKTARLETDDFLEWLDSQVSTCGKSSPRNKPSHEGGEGEELKLLAGPSEPAPEGQEPDDGGQAEIRRSLPPPKRNKGKEEDMLKPAEMPPTCNSNQCCDVEALNTLDNNLQVIKAYVLTQSLDTKWHLAAMQTEYKELVRNANDLMHEEIRQQQEYSVNMGGKFNTAMKEQKAKARKVEERVDKVEEEFLDQIQNSKALGEKKSQD